MSNKTIYETGATSHAVNDLILFTDNTKELAELRDSIYEKMYRFDLMGDCKDWDNTQFLKLAGAAKLAYRKEFPAIEDHSHIRNMSPFQTHEFCNLYLADFGNWKQEHGYQ